MKLLLITILLMLISCDDFDSSKLPIGEDELLINKLHEAAREFDKMTLGQPNTITVSFIGTIDGAVAVNNPIVNIHESVKKMPVQFLDIATMVSEFSDREIAIIDTAHYYDSHWGSKISMDYQQPWDTVWTIHKFSKKLYKSGEGNFTAKTFFYESRNDSQFTNSLLINGKLTYSSSSIHFNDCILYQSDSKGIIDYNLALLDSTFFVSYNFEGKLKAFNDKFESSKEPVISAPITCKDGNKYGIFKWYVNQNIEIYDLDGTLLSN